MARKRADAAALVGVWDMTMVGTTVELIKLSKG